MKQRILTIETTGPLASVALAEESGHIFEKTSPERMNHLRSLVAMLEELLQECSLGIGDITHIAVSRGPGSFTGTRIGISTGRAIAQARELPVISVPTLESFCCHDPQDRGLICPLFDARRSQVYGGVFSLGESETVQTRIAGAAWDPAQLLANLLTELRGMQDGPERAVTFYGDGIPVYQDLLEAWIPQAEALGAPVRIKAGDEGVQRAASAARLAWRLCQEGRALPYQELLPDYMRKAEAERKLEESRCRNS